MSKIRELSEKEQNLQKKLDGFVKGKTENVRK